MRSFILALSLIAPLAAGVTPARAAAGSAEKAVLAALDTWKEATLKKDKALFEKVYHQDLTYGHSSGMIETKEQAIQHVVGNPNNIYEVVSSSDTKVKVNGSLALLTAKLVIKVKDHEANNLVGLMVFTKTPKGWQMIGRQTTKVVPPAGTAAAQTPGGPNTPTAQTPPPVPPAPKK